MPRISSSSLKKSNIKKNADLLIIHLRVSDQVYTLIFGSISSIKVLFSFHACNVDLYFNGPRQVSNRSDLYTQRWWNFVCQLRCNTQYNHWYNTYLLSESVSISISRTTQEFTVTFQVDDHHEFTKKSVIIKYILFHWRAWFVFIYLPTCNWGKTSFALPCHTAIYEDQALYYGHTQKALFTL